MEENIQISKYISVNLELTLALFQNNTFLSKKKEPKLNVQIYIHTLVIF